MANEENNNACGFGGDIVSYIYDEATPAERASFERHLTGCTSCTDDFAGISEARFSMFEWGKEELAELETPRFVIPYEKTASVADRPVTVGVLASIRAWLAVTKWPLTAAAAIVVCIGLGMMAKSLLNGGDTQLAANARSVSVASPVVPDNIKIPAPGTSDLRAGDNTPVDTRDVRAAKTPRYTVVRTSKPERPAGAVAQRAVRTVVTGRDQARHQVKAAELDAYEDSDDNTLRLADLFDDIGG